MWYDNFSKPAPKWRAWYSTFSTCNGRVPGPNHNASDEPDCQASGHDNVIAAIWVAFF